MCPTLQQYQELVTFSFLILRQSAIVVSKLTKRVPNVDKTVKNSEILQEPAWIRLTIRSKSGNLEHFSSNRSMKPGTRIKSSTASNRALIAGVDRNGWQSQRLKRRLPKYQENGRRRSELTAIVGIQVMEVASQVDESRAYRMV